jgi:hypothetical protein
MAGLCAWLAWNGCGTVSAAEVITNFAQIYALSRAEALEARTFRFVGVVVCYDYEWNQLFVDDGNETVYFNPQNFRSKLAAEDWVEIKGVTSFGANGPVLTNLGLHSGVLAAQELGGALLVHSEGPGKGATFTLELPLRPPH